MNALSRLFEAPLRFGAGVCDKEAETRGGDLLVGAFTDADTVRAAHPDQGVENVASESFLELRGESELQLQETTSPALLSTYEKRLTAIEDEKTLAKVRAAEIAPNQGTFMRLFEPAMMFRANPYKI